MKKLYSLFLLLIGLICFTSCGDDDYEYTAPETLDVTKADLYFKSQGGTGSIEITTNRELQATSSVDWCTVSVSGGVVTAKATENPAIESRAGTITVSDGVLTSLVAVYQEGLVCIIDTSHLKSANDNSAGSTFINVDSSSPFTVTIPEDATSWLSYTKDDEGKVTFNFTANTTGTLRGACVTVTSGAKDVSITIAQYEINDLIGAWKAIYSDGKDYYQEIIEITKPEEGMLDLNFSSPAPGLNPIFHCTYTDGIMKIQNATDQGRYGSYYLYTAMFTTDNGVSWSTDYTYSGSADVTTDGAFTIKFYNDGSWVGKEINGVGLEAFSTPTPSSAGNLGYLLAYFDIILYKLP